VAEKDEHATLHYPGGELELDVVNATEGSDGIALGSLLAKTGYTTFDEGFVNTASTKSAITYIDGDAGILRYRGYPIEQLAEKSSFIEVCYLLIYGELPTKDELDKFTDQIQRHTLLHEDLKRFFDGFPRNAHPMPVVSSAVNALSAYYQDSLDPFDDEQVELSTIRLLAKLPTIAAYAYKKSVGQPFLYPDNSLSLVENFLRMTFGFPAEPYEVDPEVVRIGVVLPALPSRFDCIARTKIPYVASAGALDMVNFGPIDTVPAQYKTRNLYIHNPQVTLMRTTAAENERMGRWIGEKLNRMDGPVRFLIPERGVSLLDLPGKPFHDPAADTAFFKTLEATVRQNERRKIIRLPYDLNDPAFAAALVKHFLELIDRLKRD